LSEGIYDSDACFPVQTQTPTLPSLPQKNKKKDKEIFAKEKIVNGMRSIGSPKQTKIKLDMARVCITI